MPSELSKYNQDKTLQEKEKWVRDRVEAWLEEIEDKLAAVELDFDLNKYFDLSEYFDWTKLEEDLIVKVAKQFDKRVAESKKFDC